MKLTELQIDGWRNFREIRLEVPDDASLVCLVGENGTGKSNILEFISAAAHHLGLAPGIEVRRGNPFDEAHGARFVMRVGDRYRAPLAEEVLPDHVQEALPEWNGTLVFETRRDDAGPSTTLTVGGIADPSANNWLATHLVAIHRQAREVNYLHLDADRAYPPVSIHPQHIVEAWGQPYESAEWTRQWSYRTSKTLYEEWIKYFLAGETRVATKFTAAAREAIREGQAYPELVDPFDGFAQSVKEVLPHLTFAGVDPERRTILFDSAGIDINFDQLSGGEREISFLIGQIERFQLRTGLMLLDEPELHLNPDLVRAWIAYLRDTVGDGQVWLATHSLEAVEVAGPDATTSFLSETVTPESLPEPIRCRQGRSSQSCPVRSGLLRSRSLACASSTSRESDTHASASGSMLSWAILRRIASSRPGTLVRSFVVRRLSES